MNQGVMTWWGGVVHVALAWVVALAISPAGAAQGDPDEEIRPDATMIRTPAISASHIAFAYANNLYLVDRDGGLATRLVNPDGYESFPRFSPDGTSLVFLGGYEGQSDLYTLELIEGRAAGLAERLTHHPGTEIPLQWLPAQAGELERVLFWSSEMVGLRRTDQLFTVPAGGGMPEQLPLPYGAVSAISPDGRALAWTPHTRDFRTWKRYQGGMQTDIWLLDLRSFESERMTDHPGTDSQPMFVPGGDGQRVYYMSDAGPNTRRNIWVYDRGTRQRRQLTTFEDVDVRFPSIGPGPNGQGEIVMQAGSSLWLLDLATEQSRRVDIVIPGDRPTLRPRRVNFAEFIKAASISPGGERAVIESRGELFSVPTEDGVTRRLTTSSHSAERDPSWSPDGQWIAYLSDDPEETGDGTIGEYEVFVMQSDGKGERRRVTSGGDRFRFILGWSPDSEMILLGDKTGRYVLLDVETGDETVIAEDAWARLTGASWSHDSGWLALVLLHEGTGNGAVHLYEVATGVLTQVTDPMFDSSSPAFDHEGEFLYFVSNRRFSPTYGQIERTWIYGDASVVLMAPLRPDVEMPLAPESGDVPWDEEDEGAVPEAWVGAWVVTLSSDEAASRTVELEIGHDTEGDDGGVVAEIEFEGGREASADEVSWDADEEVLTIRVTDDAGRLVVLGLTLDDGEPATIGGTWSDPETGVSGTVSGEVAPDDAGEDEASDDAEDAGDGDAVADDEPSDEVIEIEIEGFERRAVRLAIEPGAIGNLSVGSNGNLFYTRGESYRGTGPGAGLFVFDPADQEADEDRVLPSPVSTFTMSADGEHLLAGRNVWSRTSPARWAIVEASSGQSFDTLDTSGMRGTIRPRAEWRQILTDAWRIFRDYFYDEGMHGVDWRAIYDQYAAMLPDAVTRSDVTHITREMISELNAGHAYYSGGDTEDAPRANVGLLGADLELATVGGETGYRVARLVEGAPFDDDARGPLSQPGVDVAEGDFILAVNGEPIDVTRSPWASFQGMGGARVELTVSERPVVDDEARYVVVDLMRSETSLRYRAWVERNRRYVDEQSDGRIGYIYVPNTGVDGQNELVRQFQGQFHKDALIVDERWNGGGQIPTRFIELLNRPKLSYFALRDGRPWVYPRQGHFGPKAMLINGRAGSGGDMFPYLFKQAGLGPLIGERTWGGLIGISFNPHLVDLPYMAVPRFAFYELDGTWGVEGHGVDPDIEVIADPGLLAGDLGRGELIRDPQLDTAIEHLLGELERNPQQRLTPPPAGPDRTGPGIGREEDK
ncbi:MAG: PDZ domain-containing protein [Planctomycetota bacterium]